MFLSANRYGATMLSGNLVKKFLSTYEARNLRLKNWQPPFRLAVGGYPTVDRVIFPYTVRNCFKHCGYAGAQVKNCLAPISPPAGGNDWSIKTSQ